MAGTRKCVGFQSVQRFMPVRLVSPRCRFQMVHNHPSGDPTPSRADIDMTREMAEAGKALGITLHDHLIIGGRLHASFKSLGLL